MSLCRIGPEMCLFVRPIGDTQVLAQGDFQYNVPFASAAEYVDSITANSNYYVAPMAANATIDNGSHYEQFAANMRNGKSVYLDAMDAKCWNGGAGSYSTLYAIPMEVLGDKGSGGGDGGGGHGGVAAYDSALEDDAEGYGFMHGNDDVNVVYMSAVDGAHYDNPLGTERVSYVSAVTTDA